MGLGDARLGETPEGRRDVGGDPLPLRFHGTEASRKGGGRAQMTSRLILPGVRCCAGRVVVCPDPAIGARAGSRSRNRRATGVGQEALSQVLLPVPRRDRGRRGLRHPASAPQAPQLHNRQVQGAHDAHRSAPDASGPCEHHQARHALHVDACLAQSRRPGRVGSRLLHQELLLRFLQPRDCPSAGSSPECAQRDEGVSRGWARSSTKRPAAYGAMARSVGATDLRRRP